MCMEASVDTALRVGLVLLHVLTIAGGFMTAIGLGWTTRIFGDRCILYSDMELSMTQNSSVTLNYETTEWGSLNVCYYCTFATGSASIYAIIWFWFYFLLSEWDRTNTSGFDWSLRILRKQDRDRPPPDARLLTPTLIINILLWVCVAVSLGLITKGSNIWCNSIMETLSQPCSYLSGVAWYNVPDGDLAYTYLRIAQAGNWILLFSVLAKILVVGCRLFLYLKRDPDSPRRPARHHNSLATKYISFSDDEQNNLEVDPIRDIFQDIPYADSDEEVIAASSDENQRRKPLLVDVHVENSYHQSISSDDMDSDKTLIKDRHRSSDIDDKDDSALLNSHEQSFKYNTL